MLEHYYAQLKNSYHKVLLTWTLLHRLDTNFGFALFKLEFEIFLTLALAQQIREGSQKKLWKFGHICPNWVYPTYLEA